MTTTYRPGGLGALFDLYEKEMRDLEALLRSIPPQDFPVILDAETADPDGRSVEAIARHVVRAAFGYAHYLRRAFGDGKAPPTGFETPASAEAFAAGAREAIRETEAVLRDRYGLSEPEVAEALVRTRWGAVYDAEQMLEHAIVHVMRHRRQIERLRAGQGSV